MVWYAFAFCPVNELLGDIWTTTEQIKECVCKAIKSHGCSSNADDNLLPSLNDDSEVEECERDFEENDTQDIEKSEEDRIL